jgi:hypothetical protein
MEYNHDKGTWVCEYCNEYSEENKRKVSMHEIHCKKKHEIGNEQQKQNVSVRGRETTDRRERVPFGLLQRKLHCPSDDGFHYRVFNDNWRKEPGRIQRAKRAGYEIVEGWSSVVVGTNDDGSAIKGVLMKIPEELYEEDQALKQKEVDRTDERIYGGTLEQRPGDNRYIPDGIKIHADQNEPN